MNKTKELEKLYTRLAEIDTELELEYKTGETAWAANLECEYERIESQICELENQ